MVSLGLATALIGLVTTSSLYGSRCFAALGNYEDLDAKSRYALDAETRAIRQSTAVVAFSTNSTSPSLTLTNANRGQTVQLTYNPTARTVSLQMTGQPTITLLTGCDAWNFALFQRTPTFTSTNFLFIPATNSSGVLDPTLCKLISMSWKCSRTILNQKVNTENVQTAQVVLRNKVN
ncbi:MAG TPA: hypothetical protein VN578_00225 [Candidatus Binatia bacterium]|nr:hypothetical protein [Candidatus Binatia bacterium]